ncbi:MAG: ATP-grasp domain-containing protein, partial [Saprospiraceae bacterium]|nr:ATP-grasp domain-containing protein [Saprospiraceae bacterium]
MPFVVYICPNFTANAVRFIDVLSGISEIRLGLISQEPMALLPPDIQLRIVVFQQVSDVFDAAVLAAAVQQVQGSQGPAHRLLAAVEGMQVPLAQVREQLGIEGMDVETAKNFRDKQRMKDLFRKAGLPCAQSEEVKGAKQARVFAEKVGFPLVVKPVAGAGSLSTFRANDVAELDAAMAQMPEGAALLEEFVTGDEHSFDTYSLVGSPVFHSLSHYYPNPLEAMREPWIQWQVVLPREVEAPQYDDIRHAAFEALDTLGMRTGISHLEWFRRADGSIALSEVAARPPGAQFMTLMSRAFDFDAVG